MKRFLLTFLLLFSTSFLIQGQSLAPNDGERIFVYGIRYFTDPIFVGPYRCPRRCVMEKQYLADQETDKDCDYYLNLWAYQPEQYGILENGPFIKNVLLPQISDSTIIKILWEQFDSTGKLKYEINDFLLKPDKPYKNLYYCDVSCHRFLAILVPEEVLIKNRRWQEDSSPQKEGLKHAIY